jgi:hypothetical protein
VTSRLPQLLGNDSQTAFRLSASNVRRPFTPRNMPGTHFSLRMTRPQGRRIMLNEESNDLSKNRTYDIPSCHVMSEPTALPRTINKKVISAARTTLVTDAERSSARSRRKGEVLPMLSHVRGGREWGLLKVSAQLHAPADSRLGEAPGTKLTERLSGPYRPPERREKRKFLDLIGTGSSTPL